MATISESLAFYDTEEVSGLLHLEVPVVRRWIRQGKLPAVRIGKRWLVEHGELERWIAAQPHSMQQEEI